MPTRTKSTHKQIPAAPVREEETFTFKATHVYAVLVVLAFSVGVLAGYMVWGRVSASQTAAAQPSSPVAPVATPAPRYVRYKIPTDGFPSIGPADAPITIVEFNDFQCPSCKQFRDETFQPLMDAYPNKIRFVYRNLPLSIHPEAFAAAQAAMCAGDQNAYLPYYNKLFDNQQTLGADVYLQIATDLSLDATAFQDCLDNNKYKDFVQKDMDFITNLGGNSTPTFFINGLAVIGPQPLSIFKQVIDKELAGEIPK